MKIDREKYTCKKEFKPITKYTVEFSPEEYFDSKALSKNEKLVKLVDLLEDLYNGQTS